MGGEKDGQRLNEIPRIGLKHLLPYSFIFVAAPVFTFLLGSSIDKTLNLPEFPPFPLNLCAGFSLFFFGLAVGIKSTRTLYKVGRGLPWGELSMQSRSSQLVTTGLYACCRNPMTFGYSLLPCGMGLMFQSLGMTFFVPAMVFAVMIVWIKLREEPNLEKRFGEVYLEYKRKTSFLIPRLKPLVPELFGATVRLLSGTGDDSKLNRYRLLSFAYIGTSLLGLFILASLAFSTSAYTATLAFRKQFTFLVFGAICILGAIAGIYPSKCSRVSYFGVHSEHASEKARKSAAEKVTVFKGHHPTCGNFSSHVIELRGKTYCAGCGGLIIGATISLLGALLYIVLGLNVGEAGRLAFGLGSMGVTCGLLQYNLPVKRGAVHYFLNSLFVLGAFLLLIGISEVDNIVLNLYYLTLVTYWIIARVMISRLDHRQTCTACGLAECSYPFG